MIISSKRQFKNLIRMIRSRKWVKRIRNRKWVKRIRNRKWVKRINNLINNPFNNNNNRVIRKWIILNRMWVRIINRMMKCRMIRLEWQMKMILIWMILIMIKHWVYNRNRNRRRKEVMNINSSYWKRRLEKSKWIEGFIK